jgi:hypothetical protein
LLTALTALGHQGQAEPSDYGMIVTIIYQNRPQRPDLIETGIRAEIAQRRELLTARETEVLENHLQAEVAAAIQRRLQEADRRVATINAELTKRPTSTGVRFRLLWQALPEGSEGARSGWKQRASDCSTPASTPGLPRTAKWSAGCCRTGSRPNARAMTPAAAAACSNCSGGHSITGAGTGSGCSAGRTANGGRYPVRPRAESARLG